MNRYLQQPNVSGYPSQAEIFFQVLGDGFYPMDRMQSPKASKPF
jgi:hypothetical protein